MEKDELIAKYQKRFSLLERDYVRDVLNEFYEKVYEEGYYAGFDAGCFDRTDHYSRISVNGMI
jgi:hypothetical protein